MVPPVRGCRIRRFRSVWGGVGCTLLSVWMWLYAALSPVWAQPANPDLIVLEIPAGPRAEPLQRSLPLFPPATRAEMLRVEEGVQAGTVWASASPVPVAVTGALRATEVRGLLPHRLDRHFFGLEAIRPGEPFAVTLSVEPAAAIQGGTGVNFVVLTEDGLRRFLAGADPAAVKVAQGSPMLFDPMGNRLTALVPGAATGGYTVIVTNEGTQPVTYRLYAEGGLLRDDAGQTFAAVAIDAEQGAVIRRDPLQPWVARMFAPAETLSAPVAPVAEESRDLLTQAAGSAGERLAATMPVRLIEPVRALRLSGTLLGAQGQHFFALAADGKAEETVLALHLPDSARMEGAGFWVLTQDSVRALVVGAHAEELNLARGLSVPGEPGHYEARLRLARDVLYTVVLYHRGDLPTPYVLTVQGGVLVDQYGQTNEAHAAALEVWALHK